MPRDLGHERLTTKADTSYREPRPRRQGNEQAFCIISKHGFVGCCDSEVVCYHQKSVSLKGYQYIELELNDLNLQYTLRETRDSDTLALLISLYAHPPQGSTA